MAKREYLQPFLHLMLRDDIVAWHMSKTNSVRLTLMDGWVWSVMGRLAVLTSCFP
jgi:hypothetical protein